MRLISVTLGVLGLMVAGVALALWWAGFAPFPTRPVDLASYNWAGACTVDGDNWATCSPHMKRPPLQGSLHGFRLFPEGYKTDYGSYGQWGVEGINGCWDSDCRELFHDTALQWTLYIKTTAPHFGLGSPKWVQTYTGKDGGSFALAVYTTYGACMYRKPADTEEGFHRCERIEADDPWHVGLVK